MTCLLCAPAKAGLIGINGKTEVPVEITLLRRLIASLFALGLVFGTAACSDDEEDGDDSTEEEDDSTTDDTTEDTTAEDDMEAEEEGAETTEAE